MGRRRTGQDQTTVEALLPEHAGTDLCGRLQRQRAYRRGSRGTHENVGRRRAQRCGASYLRQQTGMTSIRLVFRLSLIGQTSD